MSQGKKKLEEESTSPGNGDHLKTEETITQQCSSSSSLEAGASSRETENGCYSNQFSVTHILISGMGGVGCEIAKSIILAGVKSAVTLHDTIPCNWSDLSSNFCLSEVDIGSNRAEASLLKLSQLNTSIDVDVSTTTELSEDVLKRFQVVVLTDSSLEKQLRVAEIVRRLGNVFIVAQTRGLFAQLFCDFGQDWTVIDPINVLDSPGGFYTQVKLPKKIRFKSLAEALSNPVFVITDESKAERAAQIHLAFKTLDEYISKKNELPRNWLRRDSKSFWQMAVEVNSRTPEGPAKVEKVDEELLRTFAHVCRGVLNPIDAIMGGIAAQEIAKACTGKYTPIVQWLYFDATECLPRQTDRLLSINECKPRETRYDGQIAVFGTDIQKLVGNLQLFLVDASATSCEIMKNLAMMGAGAGKDGHVYVTDDGIVEEEILKQTCLLRKKDIAKVKSTSTVIAIKEMNDSIKATAFNRRINPESESVFDANFFGKLNGVVNCLVENRTYTNQRCMYHRKPFIASGTLGTKSSVEVVIPRLTQPSSEPAFVGNVPALAATTSVVAGIVGLELLKLAQTHKNQSFNYKNSRIDLALSEFNFSSPIESADLMRLQQLRDLPCLPFSNFQKELETNTPATEYGWSLRKEAAESGQLQLLLACIDLVTRPVKEVELMMPKWTLTLYVDDVWRLIEGDDALVLFLTLGSFIRPGVSLLRLILPPANGLNLLKSFHLVLYSYLRRKSMIYIARNVELYRALLDIIRSMYRCSALDDKVIMSLIGPLRQLIGSIDYYISLLRSPDDGVSRLSRDIRYTIGRILCYHREPSPTESSDDDDDDDEPWDWDLHSDEAYCRIMATSQFSSYRILNRRNSENIYHFTESARSSGEPNNRNWNQRIAQEMATLKASLSLTASSSIFIQHDVGRLDILKVLIVGGAHSPYANGLFEFDIYFPPNYPDSPVKIRFRTNGDSSFKVRFHFNLPCDGSVRFSRLNTSSNSLENRWNPNTTVLEILLAIKGWLNSADPYFDNPRNKLYQGTAEGNTNSKEHNAYIRSCTVKLAILGHIEDPSDWFDEVISRHFYLKQVEIDKQCKEWIAEMEENQMQSDNFLRNLRSLKDDFHILNYHLLNLDPPPSPHPTPPPSTDTSDSGHDED